MWGLRSLVVVTGASQGLGRCIAVEFSRKVAAGSVVLLMARSQEGLEETNRQVVEANSEVQVVCKAVDLAQPLPKDLLLSMLRLCKDVEALEVSVLVHNAGSVGDVSELAADMGDAAKWSAYLSLNVVSVSLLTAQFLSLPGTETRRSHVVNVTSLCAVQAFPSLGYYCVGKAAREMYLKVLAEERPDVRVLSYSPGAVHTDMVAAIEGAAADPTVRDMFKGLREGGKLLRPQDTTAKLVALLNSGNYTSGQRVDYFDLKDDS